MKKLYLLLLLLPFTLLVGCNDDDDFPSVDINVALSNVACEQGNLYVVAGQPLEINSVTTTSLTGQNSGLSSIAYYLNGYYQGTSIVAPYSVSFDTTGLNAGRYLIRMVTDILQVDKSIVTGVVGFSFIVVESEDDIPQGADPIGSTTITYTINPQD